MSTREPVEHDYHRHTGWGHDHHLSARDDGTYQGMIFTQDGCQVGDTVLCTTGYGYARARIDQVTPQVDPPDMYRVTATITERCADLGKIGAHLAAEDGRDQATDADYTKARQQAEERGMVVV